MFITNSCTLYNTNEYDFRDVELSVGKRRTMKPEKIKRFKWDSGSW